MEQTDKYRDYILSDAWKAKREWLFSHRGRRCESCRSEANVDVHHLTYERLGHEKSTDLKILCRYCHMEAHNIPIIPEPEHVSSPMHDWLKGLMP